MLKIGQTAFVLVDVQGKLAKTVDNSEAFLENLEKLVRGLQLLEIPIIWLEQYPEGLGPTDEQISRHLTGMRPIQKMTFNACLTPGFLQTVGETGRHQLLIAGIEAHICTYQTAMGLKEAGYEVQVVADAVSSRTRANKEIALEKMQSKGILLTSVEMALFELMQVAEGEQFKELLTVVK
ncbi:hydrolase [Sporosarcina sp. 179-K 3D1 HS]|uniref:hydrolase n=1 Tax=Sporosarcina sp. 179-K 3D1 HS TaxID=3232169 RepID=UPI0039A1B381